jgi:Domain of unknown function (DUF4157)
MDEAQSTETTRRWSGLVEDLRRRLGSGAGLGATDRARFEGHLGGDLSGVIVHRSPLAGHLARSLGASALTAGSHVMGDEAALDASTPTGAALLGHELTHVVQRSIDDGAALTVERALASDGRAADGPAVDADALAERVYQRLMDQVRLERERAAWIG